MTDKEHLLHLDTQGSRGRLGGERLVTWLVRTRSRTGYIAGGLLLRVVEQANRLLAAGTLDIFSLVFRS